MESLIPSTSLEVASFVCTLYRLLGGELETAGPVLKVTLEDEVAKRLDGPWAHGYNLHFVFREEDLTAQDSAELVTLGSYRLHYLLQQAFKHGRFAKLALSPDALPKTNPVGSGYKYYSVNSRITYLPALAITFAFTFQGENRWEETATFILNRGNATVAQLEWDKVMPYVQGLSDETLARVEQAELSLYRSYFTLEQAAVRWAAAKPTDWTAAARQKLAHEEMELNGYFAKLVQEETYQDPQAKSDLTQIWQLRLREQEERFAPRVFIRPIQFALIAVPQLDVTYLRINTEGEQMVRLLATPFQREWVE